MCVYLQPTLLRFASLLLLSLVFVCAIYRTLCIFTSSTLIFLCIETRFQTAAIVSEIVSEIRENDAFGNIYFCHFEISNVYSISVASQQMC